MARTSTSYFAAGPLPNAPTYVRAAERPGSMRDGPTREGNRSPEAGRGRGSAQCRDDRAIVAISENVSFVKHMPIAFK